MERIYTRIPEKNLKDAGARIAANGVNRNGGGGGATSDLSGMSDDELAGMMKALQAELGRRGKAR